MAAELTPALSRALQVAQERACRQAAAVVLPIHLLEGLIEEPEGRPAVFLAEAGTDLALARADLFPPLSGPPAQLTATRPLSEKIGEILQQAAQLAAEPTISSDLVLVTLLRMEDELRCRLEGFGLVFVQLEDKVRCTQVPSLRLEEPLYLSEPLERMGTARILDAAANRAREALRVLEDYQRFVLNDAILSGELKTLRHDLARSLAELPSNLLLAARETLRDVGTTLSTPGEKKRHSLAEVVQANFKRLQEALRSLEEYGKLHDARLGRELERLRYRCYTLERALVRGHSARQRLADARLYLLVTGSACAAAIDWTIQEAAQGGVSVVQLREKDLPDRALLERAHRVRHCTHEAGVLFIVNDRPDIARLVEADGVHVGQDELPIHEVRLIVGPDALVGVSTHNMDQVRQAILDGADYIGVGPTFPSGTKEFAEYPGLDFVRQAMAATSLPAFVIGGVNHKTLPAAVAAGARRAAVSQAICQAGDPRRAAAELLQELRG
jgi:thiamine-phosphate pyrophosphorylase